MGGENGKQRGLCSEGWTIGWNDVSQRWFGGKMKEREAMEEGVKLSPVDDGIAGGGFHFHRL